MSIVLEKWESLSALHKKLVTLLTIAFCCIFGFYGLITPAVILYFVVSSGLDACTLKWFNDIKINYKNQIKSECVFEDLVLDSTEEIKFNVKTAIRFALRAQSKVGVLPCSNVNRLVYETTLLNIFEEFGVRHNVRMDLLGDALVACFIRTENYDRALNVIKELGGDASVHMVA